ncbi:acyltransferase family protein [Enterobacter sp.]|uniref:acyltransferase n=1 Tax=Enterobacter sp. TaxID=42895 RepID=UPI0033419BD8|nr:acyltransferase family protein [Enterobacter cloacae]
MTNNRHLYVDIAKCLAIFLVIVNHTNSQIFLSLSPSITWFASVTYFYACRVAVPVFIMATGIVLLSRNDSYSTHAKRLLRILVVLAVFSVFYSYVNNGIPKSINDTFEIFLHLVSQPSTNALWYLYLYVCIILAMPFLQKLLVALTKKDVEIFLVGTIFVFGLCYTIVYLFGIRPYANINITIYSYPIMYLFAGYYIHNHLEVGRNLLLLAVSGFILSVFFGVAALYLQRDVAYNVSLLVSNLETINIAIESVSFLYIVKCISHAFQHEKALSIFSSLAMCVFGVYLISDFVLVRSLPVYIFLKEYMNPIIACIIWQITILAICFPLVWVARKIPVVRKYI